MRSAAKDCPVTESEAGRRVRNGGKEGGRHVASSMEVFVFNVSLFVTVVDGPRLGVPGFVSRQEKVLPQDRSLS